MAVALAATGTAFAGTIVIRADGPSKGSFPAGKPLSGRVALRPGDTLVVLDGRGTRTLKGPGTIDVNAATVATAGPSAFDALLRNSGVRQVRTGAVRGGGAMRAASPNLWYVDMTRSGTMCMTDMARATLWRQSMTEPATYILTRAKDGKAAPLSFATGQSVRAWPVADLPIAENTDYRLSGPGLSRPTTIRFVAIGAVDTAPDAVATALIRKGCAGQLDMLVSAGRGQNGAG